MTGAKGTGAPTPDAPMGDLAAALGALDRREVGHSVYMARLQDVAEAARALVGVQSRADHTITDEMVRVAVSVYYGWALDQPGRSLALEARMRAALRAALGQGSDDRPAVGNAAEMEDREVLARREGFTGGDQ